MPEAMSKAADVRDYERIVGDEGKAVGWSLLMKVKLWGGGGSLMMKVKLWGGLW